MPDPTPSGVRPAQIIPQDLMAFIAELDTATTSEEVWLKLVDLAQRLGVEVVDYVIATDHQDWKKVQFIRTTVSSDWIAFANSDARVRRKSTFRLHSVHSLIPVSAGLSYLDAKPGFDTDRESLLEETAEKFGVRSAIAIPLRMTEPGQAAHLMYGGDMEKEAFEALFAEHGWTLHAAALYAHTRHMSLFTAEFRDRNRLTDKQTDIIRLIGEGCPDKQIAEELAISFSAVRQRITALQSKTGCRNRAELAALAMRLGLIPDPMTKPHDRALTVFLSTGDDQTGIEHVKNDR